MRSRSGPAAKAAAYQMQNSKLVSGQMSLQNSVTCAPSDMGHADEFNGPGQGLLLNPGDYDVKIYSQVGDTLLEQRAAVPQNEVLTLKARWAVSASADFLVAGGTSRLGSATTP